MIKQSNFSGFSRITSYNVCYTKLLRVHLVQIEEDPVFDLLDLLLCLPVITSYSIHYTKLYERAFREGRDELGVQPRGGARAALARGAAGGEGAARDGDRADHDRGDRGRVPALGRARNGRGVSGAAVFRGAGDPVFSYNFV